MKPYKDFLREQSEISESSDFANLKGHEKFAKIANGKGSMKLDGVTITPDQAKSILSMFKMMPKKMQNEFDKMSTKDVLKMMSNLKNSK